MMTSEGHYDEEVLIALLDEGGDEALDRDPHIATCKTCSKTAASVRQLADVMKSPDVWDPTEISADPNTNVLSFLEHAQNEFRDEDTAADSWLRELLASPREAWTPTLHAHPEWRTAGMVRKLIEASYRAIETAPPEALELTALATDVAESLDAARYGHSTVTRHRGHAWRERAYALYFTGAYPEALTAVTRARQAFADCGYAEFDDARAGVVFALICAEQERYGEGLKTAGVAAEVFRLYRSRDKVIAAERTEAANVYLLHRYREALRIYRSLEAQANSDEERAGLAQNIAACYRELGDFENAGRYFTAAIEIGSRCGMLSSIAKTRWQLGLVFLAQGRHREALDLLRVVRHEFAESGRVHNLAEVTVDIAQTLVMIGGTTEVIVECREALSHFASAGLMESGSAMHALGLLREAALAGTLDAKAVSAIRSTISSPRPMLHLYAD